MSDRSPEPADRREWTLSPLNRQTVVLRRDSFGKWVTGSGLSESVVVVPKSRLESAMAAADERERALEAERDCWRAKFEANGLEVVQLLEDAEAHVRALTEALREAEWGLAEIAEWSLHRSAKPVKAQQAKAALARVRAALPVSVEAEPEAVETATKAAEAFVSDWEAEGVAESDGRTDA